MELTQLKYFVRLAQILNFTEASRSLFITQSTLSISIRQLEEELNTKLFDRIGKKVFLTEDGATLYKSAKMALTNLSDGIEEINIGKKIYKGTITIGVTYSTSNFLNSRIAEYTRKYPDVKLIINTYNTVDEGVNDLIHNRLDIIITYRSEKTIPSISYRQLSNSPLQVVMCREHPLAQKKYLTFDEIGQYPLVTSLKSTQTRTMINRLFLKNNVKIEPRIEVNDTNIILDLVKTANWISILSPLSIQNQPELVSIPLEGESEYLSVCIMWQKGRSKQNLTQTLLDELN